MTELSETVLNFLKTCDQPGKTFTVSELSKIGKMSPNLTQSVVNELEENGYIEFSKAYISGTGAFRLV